LHLALSRIPEMQARGPVILQSIDQTIAKSQTNDSHLDAAMILAIRQ